MLIEIISTEGLLMFILSVLTTILIGLLSWIGISFNNRLKDLTKSIESINNLLGWIKGKNMVIEADIEVIDKEISDHETRIRSVEKIQDKCKHCNNN
jgi:hypothetical protein